MTAYEEPLDGGRRPMKGWVKIVGSICVLVLVALVIWGLSHLGLFARGQAAMRQVIKPPVDAGGFSYPPEAKPVAFRPADPAVVREAASPVARPVASQAAPNGQKQLSPLDSPILAMGGPVQRAAVPAPHAGAAAVDGESTDDPLSASLRATKLDGTRVQELPDPTYTIGQGRFLTCRQITAFSSQHPGGVVAVLDEVKGDTGTVTVLDKGATLFGTSQHAMVNGSDTAFVLWQNITTIPLYDSRGIPHRYRVAANSAATNEIGETGLPGDVVRHLWSKIPALVGISLLQSLPAAAGALAGGGGNNGGTALNFIQNGGQGVQSAADSWLNRILSEPDTLRRLQGQQCGLIVMRDLDMSGAYRLRTAGR